MPICGRWWRRSTEWPSVHSPEDQKILALEDLLRQILPVVQKAAMGQPQDRYQVKILEKRLNLMLKEARR